MSFKQKIFFSQCILILALITVLLPVIGSITSYIMKRIYVSRVEELAKRLESAKRFEDVKSLIQTDPEFYLQGASIFNEKNEKVYGELKMDEPLRELSLALQSGIGYGEKTFPERKGEILYIAKSFFLENEKYVLYLTFPSYKIRTIKKTFDVASILICIGVLTVNGLLILMIIHRVIRPAGQIIDAIRAFKEGKEELLPKIELTEPVYAGEFSKLASLINSLIDRIKNQIANLTKQKEESREILESLGEGVIATDPSAKITFANHTACEMLSCSFEQIENRTLDKIENAGELLKKCNEMIIYALQTSEESRQTWSFNEKKPLFLNLFSAPLAHKDGALLVLQNKTSDFRILELGKDFVANASHELRTPITIIQGFAETLQDIPNLSKEMLQEITGKIVKTSKRLDKLVRNLLTLSDLENQSNERFSKVNLSSLLTNCVETLSLVSPEANVQIHMDEKPHHIFADAELIELAVMNILENAVKYSKNQAQIDLYLEQDQNQIRLKIQDQGIGIPEKDLPAIFERFYTVDKARSRKRGGTGLGLSIVKTILEKHQAKIQVDSKVGRGTFFTFDFPKMTY